MDTTIQIRFRHASGDIGPYNFSESALVETVKEKLLAEWPKEGPLVQETPQQTSDIKLILSGKWCEGTKALKDYRREMGELKPDTLVTMLIVVRPSPPAVSSQQQGPAKQDVEPQKGCGCAIC